MKTFSRSKRSIARIGHFAMHQQRQADALHLGQRVVGLPDVGQAGIGVGRRPRRVELHRLDEAGSGGLGHLGRRRVVGQVERHQRLETGAGRQRGDDAVAVGGGLVDGSHRRLQVGHDDGAGELGGGVGEHGSQGFAVAQVKMPVVGAGDGDLHGHSLCGFPNFSRAPKIRGRDCRMGEFAPFDSFTEGPLRALCCRSGLQNHSQQCRLESFTAR